MKFLTLLTIFLVASLASATAQRRWRRCPQRASPATCVGARDVGSTCPQTPPRRMWYYNQANRTCIPMQHLGCGGNSNRWCSRRACERRCIRVTANA